MITLEVGENPIVWQRPGRTVIRGNVISYDKQTKEKEQTRWLLKGQYREEPLKQPLFMDITFFRSIPKATSKKMREQMLHDFVKCSKRPDLDNLVKYILDCMTGIVFDDDAQVVELNLRKKWSMRPATLIRVKPYTTTDIVAPDEYIEDLYDDQYI